MDIVIKGPDPSKRSLVQVVSEGEKITVTGLPEKGILEGVAKDSEGNFYVYYHANGDRLAIGKVGEMMDIDVARSDHYRDGGSMVITYTEGGSWGNLSFWYDSKESWTHERRGKTTPLEKLFFRPHETWPPK